MRRLVTLLLLLGVRQIIEHPEVLAARAARLDPNEALARRGR